jgi:hypothetical protein
MQTRASTEFIFKNQAIRCSQLKKFRSATKIVDFRRRIQAQAYTMFAGKFPSDRDQDCTFERYRCEIRYLKVASIPNTPHPKASSTYLHFLNQSLKPLRSLNSFKRVTHEFKCPQPDGQAAIFPTVF